MVARIAIIAGISIAIVVAMYLWGRSMDAKQDEPEKKTGK